MTRALSTLGLDVAAPGTAAGGLIALVVPEPANRVFSDDPFFPSILDGVSEELGRTDHHPVLMMANSLASYDHVRRYALTGHVAGALLVSVHVADPLPVALRQANIPMVAMERLLGRSATPIVGVDSLGGAAAAARHLVERGRTRIATLCGPLDMPAGIDRLAGFRQGLRGAAAPVAVAVGDFTRESGERGMHQLLRDAPALDAVFVASDLMALGALQALRSAGRRVPDDVAVIGFDDSPVARYADPPLSTVRQPIVELGRLLARQVVRLIAGASVEDAVILDTELIVRAST